MRSKAPVRRRQLAIAAAVAALLATAVAGCGSSSDSGSGSGSATLPGASTPASTTSTSSGSATTAAPSAGEDASLSIIPAARQEQYTGISRFYQVGPNPYENWTPPKPPWKICYNDSYQGNSWRKAGLTEAVKLNQQLVDAGLSKGEMDVANADNDVNTQVSQLNNQVSQGCQVILAQPASPTGLCSATDNAFEHDVLVITIVAPAACRSVINTGFNDYKAGFDTARWLAQAIGGKGNVLIVGGIPGVASSEARTAGAEDGLKTASDVDVVGTVAGQWTPSVAKTQTLKFLSTHPQQIDGVWQAALMMPAVGQAFQQIGRDLPKITGFAGECAELAYWKDNRLSSTGFNQGGAPAIYEAFYIANRMLAGAKPVSSLMLYPLPTIDDQNLDRWWRPDMTVNSTCDSVPPDHRAVADDYWSPLLKGGSEPKVTLQP